ncbi:hypothetical protein VNI00_004527 [Paramarasmius palmivorus]|uniref:FAD-binding domain-containing protein n=1 Tax=Paramarasmius palmivorus TaxID=297713 RepID=A0AAW0DJA2_9AGAR
MASSVLIVGAGPAGLSLALLLLRNGISVKIIDKAPKHFIGTRGAGVMPRTLELYKIAGILPQIEGVGNLTLPKLRIYTSPEGDAPINEFHMLEHCDPEPSYHRITAMSVHQDEHQAALREIIENEYGVSVELATELVSFEQSPEHVTVQLAKLAHGTTEAHQFDWVVGTDGARSVVRKQLELSFDGSDSTDIWYAIGDIEMQKTHEEDVSSTLRPFDHLANGHISTGGSGAMSLTESKHALQLLISLTKLTVSDSLGLRPYERNGKKYCWFICGGANVDVHAIEGNRDRLVGLMYDIIGKREISFGDLVAFGTWRSNVRMANKFNVDRVFLGGDAAHVHSFTGAQGVNTSVQDSFNLAWKLSLVQKGLAPRSLLDSYSAERVPVVAGMLGKTTAYMHQTFSNVENKGEGWKRDWTIRQFGINYRGSPIILDERYTDTTEPIDPYRSGDDKSAHAGDRAPEAPGLQLADGRVTSIFNFLDYVSHTVLIFGEGELTKVVEKLPLPSGVVKSILVLPAGSPFSSDNAVVDAEGFAHKHYKVKEGEKLVVVIRPDGYIGAVSKSKSGVVDYFKRILL